VGILRDKVIKDLSPYNGVVTLWYTGLETGSSTVQTLVKRIVSITDNRLPLTVDHNGYFQYTGKSIQDSEQSGYKDLLTAQHGFIGKKVRINVTGDSLALFYDNYDPAFGSLIQPNPNPNTGSMIVRVSCVDASGCDVPDAEVTLHCGINTDINYVSVDLEAEDYVAQISNCCCKFTDGYSGTIALKYLSLNGVQTLYSPDLGKYSTDAIAQKNYISTSLGFSHLGGPVQIWLTGDSEQSGEVTVTIQRKACLEQCLPVPATGSTLEAHPFDVFTYCDMPSEQLDFYECGWNTGACCGACVDIGGTHWLVILRSLGADASCGGGESAQTECIREAQEAGFYPAIAFPSADCEHFLGKPTSGFQRFMRDMDLESQILAKIQTGDVLKLIGDPLSNIGGILFPTT
jgi:hypothetical protein